MNIKIFMMLLFPVMFLFFVRIHNMTASDAMKIGLAGAMVCVGYLYLKIIDELYK
jgi:hypothetical protein